MITKKLIFLTLFMALLFAFASCDCGEDDDDEKETPQEVWEDSTSGLMWQNTSACCFDIDSGQSYCKNLKWGGYNDWRLPSISELRTLIRECDSTETGGECGVTDDCLAEESCYDKVCAGCIWNSGPGIDGFHWPPELAHNLPGDNYLSSSEVTDYEMVESEFMIWVIGFQNGRIFSYYNVLWNTRCVRDVD